MKKLLPLLFLLIPFACSKDKEDETVIYRYEVECQQCSVSYTSSNGRTVTESVSGKMVKEIRFTIEIDVVINIVVQYSNTSPITARIYRNNSLVESGQSTGSYSVSHRSSNGGSSGSGGSSNGCGTYNGRSLRTGPKGGCYYINKNGNKTYVDRSYCKC